jgi:LysR family transcriptional repressor of citA
MDIKWLQTFVIAATYQNFRQSSERLFLAQPTVTMHIKRLEETLEMKLFERTGRHVILTAAGLRFLPHAKQLLQNYKDGLDDLESWRQGYSQKLTLSVSPLIAASILPSVVRRFIGYQPQIEVVVKVLESKDIGEDVASGRSQLGLTRMKPIQNEVTYSKLYDDPVVFVVPHDGGELENSPPLDSEKLISTQMILSHNHPVYWDELLSDIRQYHPRVRNMVVSQVHITKRFIEEGLGVSFLPRSTIKREIIEGRMLEIDSPYLSLPTASTYLLSRYDTPESKQFIQFLQQSFSF